MGDHDLLRGKGDAYTGVCRCGLPIPGDDTETVIAAHEKHFQTVMGLAGVAEARKALEGGTDA